jgi:hypothetical protein
MVKKGLYFRRRLRNCRSFYFVFQRKHSNKHYRRHLEVAEVVLRVVVSLLSFVQIQWLWHVPRHPLKIKDSNYKNSSKSSGVLTRQKKERRELTLSILLIGCIITSHACISRIQNQRNFITELLKQNNSMWVLPNFLFTSKILIMNLKFNA